jgi:hypothetical protein
MVCRFQCSVKRPVICSRTSINVARLDLMSSIRLQRSPVLQPTSEEENDIHAQISLPSPPSHMSSPAPKREPDMTPPPSPAAIFDPYQEALTIASGLHYLSVIKLQAETSPNKFFLDDIMFSDKIALVERRSHFLKTSEDLNGLDFDAPLFRAFGHAALIYIYSVLRDFPDGNALHLDLQKQLVTTLQDVNPRTALASYHAMFLWILIVGGSVNGVTEAKTWFVRQTAEMAFRLRIEPTETDILEMVGEFPWAACRAANGRSLFWRELGEVTRLMRLSLSPKIYEVRSPMGRSPNSSSSGGKSPGGRSLGKRSPPK